MSELDNEIPEELVDKLITFEQAFDKMNEVLHPLTTFNINSPDIELDPLDRARLNLLHGYYLNTLFWIYLKTLGINPREHKIKEELDKYKEYFARIKELADKDKAPKLDKGAAQRFVRGALWTPKESETEGASPSSHGQSESMEESGSEKNVRPLSPSGERFVNRKKRQR